MATLIRTYNAYKRVIDTLEDSVYTEEDALLTEFLTKLKAEVSDIETNRADELEESRLALEASKRRHPSNVR